MRCNRLGFFSFGRAWPTWPAAGETGADRTGAGQTDADADAGRAFAALLHRWDSILPAGGGQRDHAQRGHPRRGHEQVTSHKTRVGGPAKSDSSVCVDVTQALCRS